MSYAKRELLMFLLVIVAAVVMGSVADMAGWSDQTLSGAILIAGLVVTVIAFVVLPEDWRPKDINRR